MEEKFNEMWKSILDEFVRIYYEFEDQIIDWYPSGRNEIIIQLNDGRKLRYEWITKKYQELNHSRQYNHLDNERDWKNNFSKRLNLKMRNSCITQERLAAKTGISLVTINKYATGQSIPSAFNLERIAEALKCSMYELTGNPIN